MRSVWPVWVGVVLVAATGCKKEEKTLPGELSIAPAALDFGTVAVGEESSLDVTLSNAGGSAVNLLTVSLVDGDPDVFAVARPGDVVEPGGSLLLTVTFAPEDEEVSTGRVQIRSDDAALPSFDVLLDGVGGPSNVDDDGDGYTVAEGDCDDANDTVHPRAPEGCDGRDTDCDGDRPAAEADDDYDGYLICEGDCDDANGSTWPDAPEICDGEDNDCDGSANENVDDDSDGFTICSGDCDDGEPLSFPGNPEVCDGVDNDCDTGVDDIDQDGDGHSVCSSSGDCDDNDATAYPIVVSTAGSSTGAGTDASPVDSLATAFGMLDAECRLVVLEAGTYTNVAHDWTSGVITIAGRTGDPDDVVLEAAQYSRHFTITGGNVELRDLTLRGGDAAEDGGAVYVDGAGVVLSHVFAVDNASALDGGAVAVLSGNLELRRGCRFENNVAGEDGGAVQIDASALDDRGSTWRNNQAPAGQGGALSLNGGTVSVADAEFRGNQASEGGAIAVLNSGDFTFEANAVAANTSTGDGGGFAFRDVGDPSGFVRNCTIQDNDASGVGGGAAFLGYSGALSFVNNTLTGNDATGEGAGIAVELTSTAPGIQIAANVLQDNDGPSALHVASGVGASVVFNTAFLQNSGVHFGGEVGDGSGAPLDTTNRVRNPQLVAVTDDGNPDNDDLHLQAGSPEVDSGPPDPAYDDLDASRNDRGYTGGPGAR